MDTNQVVFLATAARKLNISRQRIYQLVDAGQITPVETADGHKLIPLAEIARRRASRAASKASAHPS